MNKLLQFEDQFNSLLARIIKTPWPALKLVMLKDLHKRIIESLNPNQQLSFLMQIEPLITEAMQGINNDIAIDPALLEWGFNHESLNTQKLDWSNQAILIAFSYFRLGTFDKLCSFINRVYNLELNVHIQEDASHKKQGEFLELTSESLPEELYSSFSGIFKQNRFHSSHHTVNGLFVIQSGNYAIGILAKLSNEHIVKSEKLALDQVRIATHLVDESDIISEQTQAVCRYLHYKYNDNDNIHIRLEYALDQPSSLLIGSSAGLAFAILGNMSLFMYKRNRNFQSRVYSDVAFTGAIDERGNILPVDEKSLKYKIEAAFFYGIRVVVVPESQSDLAKDELENIQQKYPFHDLEILPLSNIEDIEIRRDVIHYQRRKVSSRISQFVREYANSVTYSIMAFILLLAAGFWFGIVKHPVPDHTIAEKDKIAVKNRYGFTIWESETFGNKINTNVCEHISKVYDLNNDGKLEILIGYGNNASGNYKGQLVCYSEKREILWQVDAGDEVQYGDNFYSDYFEIEQIFVDDLDNDKLQEICFISSQGYFPNRIVTINSSGQLISEYWNVGGIKDIIAIDLIPDNGYKELIFSGRNNEYKTGIILVIDPFKISGKSPQTSHYYTKINTQDGNEIYYIRFPLTHYRFSGYRDMTFRLALNSNQEIRIYLTSELSKSGSVHYIFDKTFNVKFTDLDDSYYRAYRKVFPDKEMLKYNDPELIKYFREVEYWDGDKWVKDPMMNQLYIKDIEE